VKNINNIFAETKLNFAAAYTKFADCIGQPIHSQTMHHKKLFLHF